MAYSFSANRSLPSLRLLSCYLAFLFRCRLIMLPIHSFQLYHHGEKIMININIRNNSNKTVKKIKSMVQQCVDVCIFSSGQYKATVASIETQLAYNLSFRRFSIMPFPTFQQTFNAWLKSGRDARCSLVRASRSLSICYRHSRTTRKDVGSLLMGSWSAKTLTWPPLHCEWTLHVD
jgi:hypothetical protein